MRTDRIRICETIVLARSMDRSSWYVLPHAVLCQSTCAILGVLLHLDFLSIETGASQWLLDVWDVQRKMSDEQLAGRFNVHVLPGWAYSRALALFITEESKIEKVCSTFPVSPQLGFTHCIG